MIYQYEERILDEENHGETQGKLLFVTSDQTQNFTNSQGRWGKGFRGRGRGRFNAQERTADQSREKKDMSKIICYRCDKPGHFASTCPDRTQKNHEANKVETEQADPALYMHEVVFLNEENLIPKNYETNEGERVWYLDNGASNHMTGSKDYFLELNENIKGKVKFGDGSYVKIEGKWSILFQSKTDEQKLITNIYYIPELKSNITYLGIFTKHF